MAIACLILLMKWEKEVIYKIEGEVLQIGLSIISHYNVYILESNNIINSLHSSNKLLSSNKKKPTQIVSKLKECIENGQELSIKGINYCLFTSNNGDSEIIKNVKCELYLVLKGKTKFGTNLFCFLPKDLLNNFPIYVASNEKIYNIEYVCFTVSHISSGFNSEIHMVLAERKHFIDLEGEVISMKNETDMILIRCRINESGILFSFIDFGWDIFLGGNAEEWMYSFE